MFIGNKPITSIFFYRNPHPGLVQTPDEMQMVKLWKMEDQLLGVAEEGEELVLWEGPISVRAKSFVFGEE